MRFAIKPSGPAVDFEHNEAATSIAAATRRAALLCMLGASLSAATAWAAPWRLVPAQELQPSGIPIFGHWQEATPVGPIGSRYFFEPDGRYAYYARFSIDAQRRLVEVVEEGQYGTAGRLLYLAPSAKVYVENGISRPDTPTPRTVKWYMHPEGNLFINTGLKDTMYRRETGQ